MVIRQFKQEDNQGVKDLIISVLTKEFPFDKKAYSDSDLNCVKSVYGGSRETFYVVEDKGHIVGTVGVKEDGKTTALMRRIFLDPAYRGKGIGTTLVDKVMEFCLENGYSHIVFRGTSRMVRAIDLCKKKGFTERERLDIGGINLHTLQLDI
ncbi:MAG: GNAT family N-acetyltransferase [Candidatus Omnitrophica bacterium]|nr:GNAT family N-acetyltransferase [Candidatus Omnitrophota bacterium]